MIALLRARASALNSPLASGGTPGLTTSQSLTPPRLVMPGLDLEAVYRIDELPLPGRRPIGPNRQLPEWFADGTELTGRTLGASGIQLPGIHPETAILLHLQRT